MSGFTFPTIIPNSIDNFELPDFGVKIYENDDGSETRRFVHQQGNHTKIMLKYQGRTETEVATIINFWGQVRGLKEAFTLPPGINRHPTDYKESIDLLGDTTLWRFASAIKFITVYTKIYNFDVPLISVIS
ncbi:MAG: hypothetical protein WBH12_09580 [Sediminibacterium sp.]